jgi:hypothetical protein
MCASHYEQYVSTTLGYSKTLFGGNQTKFTCLTKNSENCAENVPLHKVCKDKGS